MQMDGRTDGRTNATKCKIISLLRDAVRSIKIGPPLIFSNFCQSVISIVLLACFDMDFQMLVYLQH